MNLICVTERDFHFMICSQKRFVSRSALDVGSASNLESLIGKPGIWSTIPEYGGLGRMQGPGRPEDLVFAVFLLSFPMQGDPRHNVNLHYYSEIYPISRGSCVVAQKRTHQPSLTQIGLAS